MNLTITLASWLIVAMAGVAAAQTAPPAGPPPGAPPRGRPGAQRNAVPPQGPVNVQRAEIMVQEQWNVLVLKQARPFLALTDQQYPTFFLKMTTLQDVRDKHFRDRRRVLNELAKLTDPQSENPPTEATLVTKTKELDDLEAQAAQQERVAVAAVDETLTPSQRARFRVFEERMDERKLQMLAQVIRIAPVTPPAAGQQKGRDGAPPANAVKPGGRGGGR